MKLAVLGATSPTGQCILMQALEKGYDVVAIVRTPDKNKIIHDQLKVVTANIFDGDDMAQHLEGCDALLSCVGPPPSLKTFFKHVSLYSESAKSIVAALQKANVKRLVFISSWGVDSLDGFAWYWKAVFKGLLKQSLRDLSRMEAYLRDECPHIDFTSFRLPELTKRDMTGGEILMEPGLSFSPRMQMQIPRADVARGMLQIVEENTHLRECVLVGLPNPK